MYLAGILGLCALLHGPVSGHVGGGPLPLAIADATTIRTDAAQEPAKPEAPPAQATPPDQNEPAQSAPAESQAPQATQEGEKPKPPATPAGQEQKPPAAPAGAQKSTPHKKPAASQAGQGSNKKVVRHGSAIEPITQLTPGMSEEEAAHQRAATNQLMAYTDASLQKLSGRTLSKEQQDTVAQIRKFQEQAKQADSAGDLRRANKLALKARLLSDALTKQ